jgi:DNA primase
MAFACDATLPDSANATPELKTRAAQVVYEIIANAESEVARSEFVKEAATQLRLPLAAAQKDFQTFLQRLGRQAAARPAQPTPEPAQPVTAHTAHSSERDLLLICLHFENFGKPLSASLPHTWIDLGHPAGVLLNRFLGEFEHDGWPGRDHLEGLLENDAERSMVATLLFETPSFDDPNKVIQEGLRQLRSRALEPRLRQIELALANPRADIDSDPISLLKERSELQRQLRQPIALVLPPT